MRNVTIQAISGCNRDAARSGRSRRLSNTSFDIDSAHRNQSNSKRLVFFGQLSPAWQWLVALMHEMWFGKIEGLSFDDGEPKRSPTPKVTRWHRFGERDEGQDSPLNHVTLLNDQVVDMIEYFKKERTLVVDVLMVQHGLPFRAEDTMNIE